jgi:hypothetical protein
LKHEVIAEKQVKFKEEKFYFIINLCSFSLYLYEKIRGGATEEGRVPPSCFGKFGHSFLRFWEKIYINFSSILGENITFFHTFSHFQKYPLLLSSLHAASEQELNIQQEQIKKLCKKTRFNI